MSFIELAGGLRLRLSDRGDGDRAFVLVHGWKQSHRLWDLTIARLAERHRVVAFDLRGMGESDKPGSHYDFDELSGDLAAILSSLDLNDTTLVGWSMGCTVSLQHMQRGGDRVGRLVLVNGPLRLTTAPDFPYAMSEQTLNAYLDDVASHWPLRERAFVAESLREAEPEHVEWLTRIALQTPLDVALRVVREQAKLDQRSVVGELDVPVLAVYGRHDPYYPVELATWIADTAQKGESVIFEKSAHCIPFEEPDRFVSVLETFHG